MTREEIEKIPEQVASGLLTWEQAVRQIVVFVLQNKGLFCLYKQDDDYISELIIEFLVRGTEAFEHYEKDAGSFITYIFCFVRNICSAISRKKSNRNKIDFHNISESIIDYETKMESYQNIQFSEFDRPKVPYNYKAVSYEDFQIACKTDSYKIKQVLETDKIEINSEIKEKLKAYSPRMIQNIIMVLALKSSYYITEEQIKSITKLFDIDYDKFHQIILDIKNEIEEREINKEKIEMRRNKAYFYHKNLKEQMDYSRNVEGKSDYEIMTLDKKYKKNTSRWTNLNHQLEEGKVVVRPTTKLIAKVLGISTRQVTYYQTTARKLGIDLSKV